MNLPKEIATFTFNEMFDLHGAALTLLGTLRILESEEGAGARVTFRALSARTGRPPATLSRALADLERRGYIRIERGLGRAASTYYPLPVGHDPVPLPKKEEEEEG